MKWFFLYEIQINAAKIKIKSLKKNTQEFLLVLDIYDNIAEF